MSEINKKFRNYFILALAYKENFEFKKAENAYLKALEIEPKSTDTLYNLANLYTLMDDIQKSIECFDRLLTINPDDTEAKYFLSLNYMKLKDYKNGLKYFENRLCRTTAIKTQEKTFPNLMKNAKLWQGEDISDKILYTYYEAGFGDMIMFARYIKEVQKRCKHLIIKPQRELYKLFKENFDGVEVMDLFYDERIFNFDYHVPFLSIPYVLDLDNEHIFMKHNKYINANIEKVRYYKEKFFDIDKFKIAIKWQGNTFYETDRVIDVKAFAPLFDLPDVKIYSFQAFEGSENLQKLSSNYDITDVAKSFNDFSDTAAALENIDLVICSDTSLAHLAGAMGKPCIILLPYNYNWRWHTDLTHCDWYDNTKLYRLKKDESWTDMMKRIVSDIG